MGVGFCCQHASIVGSNVVASLFDNRNDPYCCIMVARSNACRSGTLVALHTKLPVDGAKQPTDDHSQRADDNICLQLPAPAGEHTPDDGITK